MQKVLISALTLLSLFACGGPALARSPKPSPSPATTAAKVELIDLNKADEAGLRVLPGIGPVHAKKIIEGRPYKSKDQLVSKKILSQGQYDKIKDRIIAKQK